MRAISEVLLGKELRPIDPFGFPDCFLSSGVLDTSACLIKGVNDRAGNADIEMERLTFESSRNEVSSGSLKLLSPPRLSAPDPQ